MKIAFKVGETKMLSVQNSESYSWYYADGVGRVQGSDLELLLLEVSGSHGNADSVKHKYDFIKGTFGGTAEPRFCTGGI
ncbi:hypothetical protein INT45_007677 [Circinella minor]|uniref:Uncharacterized protein n=1 Tax=Circinella minor TaxID=1195481 RepID=A0A8H7RTM3_9FUNG|nr:hypothetical protein INT45_007677 [Circinella minor]